MPDHAEQSKASMTQAPIRTVPVMLVILACLMRSPAGDEAPAMFVMAIVLEGLMRPLLGMPAGANGAIEAMMQAGPQGKAVTPSDEDPFMRAMSP